MTTVQGVVLHELLNTECALGQDSKRGARPAGTVGSAGVFAGQCFLCLALQEMDYTFFISKFILYYAKYLFNWHSFSVHSSYFPAMSVQRSSFHNMTLDLYCKCYIVNGTIPKYATS